MSSLLDRYRAGEHLQVYAELVRQPGHPEAFHVAGEIAGRVRRNLELLAERWRDAGFELESPFGEPISPEVLSHLEESVGTLPATLRTFYEQIGSVSFIEEPPDDDWPAIEQFDPIQVMDLEDQIEEIEDTDEPQITICLDALLKFDIGGVGPLYVPLPADRFDPVLYFEGAPVSDELGPRFVEYLRIVILEGGGMGLERPGRDLLASLVDGLIPF